MRRLRIVGDGLVTKIADADTGEEIENVVGLRVEHRGGEPPRAWLEIVGFGLDMVADEEPADDAESPRVAQKRDQR